MLTVVTTGRQWGCWDGHHRASPKRIPSAAYPVLRACQLYLRGLGRSPRACQAAPRPEKTGQRAPRPWGPREPVQAAPLPPQPSPALLGRNLSEPLAAVLAAASSLPPGTVCTLEWSPEGISHRPSSQKRRGGPACGLRSCSR